MHAHEYSTVRSSYLAGAVGTVASTDDGAKGILVHVFVLNAQAADGIFEHEHTGMSVHAFTSFSHILA